MKCQGGYHSYHGGTSNELPSIKSTHHEAKFRNRFFGSSDGEITELYNLLNVQTITRDRVQIEERPIVEHIGEADADIDRQVSVEAAVALEESASSL